MGNGHLLTFTLNVHHAKNLSKEKINRLAKDPLAAQVNMATIPSKLGICR